MRAISAKRVHTLANDVKTAQTNATRVCQRLPHHGSCWIQEGASKHVLLKPMQKSQPDAVRHVSVTVIDVFRRTCVRLAKQDSTTTQLNLNCIPRVMPSVWKSVHQRRSNMTPQILLHAVSVQVLALHAKELLRRARLVRKASSFTRLNAWRSARVVTNLAKITSASERARESYPSSLYLLLYSSFCSSHAATARQRTQGQLLPSLPFRVPSWSSSGYIWESLWSKTDTMRVQA